jgi:hypothetical protein
MSAADLTAQRNLRLVQSGRRTRAPGIRRCGDCDTAFIDDHSGLPLCVECRPNHTRQCAHCPARFTNTPAGDRLCSSCRQQPALFDTEVVTP